MSPTITVASFFFFFVRPQNVCVVDTFYRTTKSTAPASGIISELLQRVPPFVYSIFNVRYKTGRNYRVPPLNFFRHGATFFSNFLLSPNGPPFKFFDILQQTEVLKSPKGPPSLVFRHCETFKILIFRFFEFSSKKFQIFLLSPNGPPLKFFDILQQTEISKSPKGPPSLVFGTVRLFQNSHFSFFRKFFQKNFRIFYCLLQFF